MRETSGQPWPCGLAAALARAVLAGSVALAVAWAGTVEGAARPTPPAANLIRNGDFEAPSASSPPPGWTMWGAQQYKNPTHFTRDTTQPHGGGACFRIHHPAGTAGYVVTTPEQPIRTQPGACLRVTFWARAARPGTAVFGFDGYESIQPYRGAPSPGLYPVPVGPDWRRHEFEVHEGWDFFAKRTPLLLLIVKATAETQEQQTLWIDDVVATQTPSPRRDRLIDPLDLDVPPIDHGLGPGERLEFTLDPARRLRPAMRRAGGVSFHRVAGWAGLPFDKQGRYVLPPDLEEAVREMRLPMTRFYALGDEPFGLEAAIDRAADLCRRIGVPCENVVLEFEIQGATQRLPPDVWARGVRHALAKGHGFRHWEITNEPYVQQAKANFPTADAYVEHFLEVARAVRSAHPDGRIGLPIHPRSDAWGNYLLKRAAGHYDFVVGHYYQFADVGKASFEEIALGANCEVLGRVQAVNALIRAYNPGREVDQLDTEWGMHSSGPGGERADYVRRNANIVGTMHRAVRMVYYLRGGYVSGASSWEMFTRSRAPGFCVLAADAPDRRSMIYWLYYYMNRHVGEWVLATTGTAPYWEGTDGGRTVAMPQTPTLATVSDDGRTVHLVIANGSWSKAAPCVVHLAGFEPAEERGVALSHDDLDGHPLLERREDFVHNLPVRSAGSEVTFTVPAHAIVFVALHRKKAT